MGRSAAGAVMAVTLAAASIWQTFKASCLPGTKPRWNQTDHRRTEPRRAALRMAAGAFAEQRFSVSGRTSPHRRAARGVRGSTFLGRKANNPDAIQQGTGKPASCHKSKLWRTAVPAPPAARHAE